MADRRGCKLLTDTRPYRITCDDHITPECGAISNALRLSDHPRAHREPDHLRAHHFGAHREPDHIRAKHLRAHHEPGLRRTHRDPNLL